MFKLRLTMDSRKVSSVSGRRSISRRNLYRQVTPKSRCTSKRHCALTHLYIGTSSFRHKTELVVSDMRYCRLVRGFLPDCPSYTGAVLSKRTLVRSTGVHFNDVSIESVVGVSSVG
ncbi:hypothetical protein BaRGS_00016768 [Batillaria attramentaria]|uniref:Uncharacterized protein n=1 Tax=Batillaria attramentaria TaxID=370345 RepID=A0ABD0KYS0_9CAEN